MKKKNKKKPKAGKKVSRKPKARKKVSRKPKARKKVSRKPKARKKVSRKPKARKKVSRKPNVTKKDTSNPEKELIFKTRPEWVKNASASKSQYQKKYTDSIKNNNEFWKKREKELLGSNLIKN